MPEKHSDDTKAAREYPCEYCDAVFLSRQGLAKHRRVCEYRPDDEDGGGPPTPGAAGVDLFGADASDTYDTGDDVYQCPDCGYSAKRAFARCPTCAADLEW